MNRKIFAVKYATRSAQTKSYYHGHSDPHENTTSDMDYFVWVIQDENHTILVDCGFTKETAEKRGRTYLHSPVDSLASLGISPNDVDYIIISHLHYDHIGNITRFPKAKFFIQEKEMSFWTGKYAGKKEFKHHIEVEDVLTLVEENFNNRVIFVNGNKQIFPGIEVILAPGHSAGLQMVAITDGNSRILLTSDASHFYNHYQEDRLFSTLDNLPGMYDSLEMIREEENRGSIIVPGHDPLVMEKFEKLEGHDLIVRINSVGDIHAN